MASYRIEWRRSTKKDLRGLSPEMVRRIALAVEELTTQPIPMGAVKLHGSERAYRIRVGDYRVLYEVFDEVLIIEVVRVGHR